MRNMIADKSAGWPDQVEKELIAADYDAEVALARMGELIAGQIRQSINNYPADPPLSPATIKRKGHGKPLVDSGHMVQSVDYEVE